MLLSIYNCYTQHYAYIVVRKHIVTISGNFVTMLPLIFMTILEHSEFTKTLEYISFCSYIHNSIAQLHNSSYIHKLIAQLHNSTCSGSVNIFMHSCVNFTLLKIQNFDLTTFFILTEWLYEHTPFLTYDNVVLNTVSKYHSISMLYF